MSVSSQKLNMASLLLGISVYTLVAVALSKPHLEASCPPPANPDNTSVTFIFGGRAAIITCGNATQRMALCVDGSWTSSVSCSEEKTQEGLLLPKRAKRNTGKYHELRKRVKIQRQLRAGLLETTIDDTMPTIFRAHPSGNVYLPCRVENLGAHSVIWSREKDGSVFAIDTLVYIPDKRISAIYEEQTQTWFLKIHSTRKRDEGKYVCKVTTKVPLERTLTLQIIPPDQPLHGPIRLEDHDLNFVVRNLTALWEEVSDIRQEIVRHLHEGHKEDNHDEVMREVEGLHHEHHVHHLHHPHVGHNEHHSDELLMHLEGVHGHIDDHTAGQPVHGHLHGPGPSHDHLHGPPKERGHDEDDDDSHEGDEDDHDHDDHDHDDHKHDDHKHDDHDHDERTGHRDLHPNPDEHDAHGLHSHEDEHEYGHEHDHDHASDDVDHHGHDDHSQGGHGAPPSRPGAPGAPGAPGMVRPGLAPLPGSLRSGRHPSDTWMHASCALKPNKDVPTSNVHGTVIISQRKDGKGPVYFDIHLSGIDVASTGRLHGFHVHERQVTDDSCGSTGGHFNPTGVTHGAPGDDVRHVGDLGNIEVKENGELRGYVIHDDKVTFDGTNSIIGKALVVHAGVDDLGLGGDAGSLATGNAGGRLACCTIHMGGHLRQEDLVTFRIKG